MTYSCEWSDCNSTFDDFETYYCHVREHTTEFYDEDDASAACLWRECFSNSCETEEEFLRHVLFHGYHTFLKELGLKTQNERNLSPCTLDTQARNLVPDFPDSFCCQWDKCEMFTCCPRYYYRHVNGHSLAIVEENGVISCKWKDCSFTCRSTHKLKEHCRTHTHEKCVGCPNCGGLFANKTKFMDHLRRQNTMESESYQCSHCFKYCASERILRDHMRHHVNNVKCSFCDMTCPDKSALQHHLNFRHSDDKPFSCDMCDSSFKSANDLRRHQQTHNPVYDFSCELENCNFVTKTLQSLRRHYKVYHEGPAGGRYECHICEKRYSRGTGLTKHLKKQHTFRWPAGHTRFRYKEHDDGMYRLQTVRFESVELSQQLDASDNVDNDEDPDDTDCQPSEGSNHHEIKNMTAEEYENQLRIERRTTLREDEGHASTGLIEASNNSSPLPSHQSLLDMLNQFSENRYQTETNTDRLNATSTLDGNSKTAGSFSDSTNINDVNQLSNGQDVDALSREDIAARAVLDLQEAASLLATLRNSGMTS